MLINKLICLFFLVIIVGFELKIHKYNSVLNNKQIKKICNICLKNKNNFYKELLELYVDNKEKFYLKGRTYITKNNLYNYNDSNIETIQDKLNYLLVH